MNIVDVYTKKEYECKQCKGKIYYAKIATDGGEYYTTDGKLPNGKFGKESNVLSGAVDVLVKDRLHECSAHFVTDKIQQIEGNSIQPENQNLDEFDPMMVSEEEQEVWNSIVDKVAEYELLAQKRLGKKYPGITNPQARGLIVNNSFTVLNEIKRAQREKQNES